MLVQPDDLLFRSSDGLRLIECLIRFPRVVVSRRDEALGSRLAQALLGHLNPSYHRVNHQLREKLIHLVLVGFERRHLVRLG